MLVDMKKFIHITQNERDLISVYLAQGKGFREIGRLLGRDHKAISKEVNLNSVEGKTGERVYLPSRASEEAFKRKSRTTSSKLSDPAVQRFVISKLNRHWSPEQIAGRLKLKAPNSYVCTESIYKFIYSKETRDLRLWEFLRKSHKKRQSLFSRKQQRLKRLQIPNKTNIESRPEEANLRVDVGHMESDLMEGVKTSKDVVSVTTDRKAKYLMLDKLPNKESEGRIKVLNNRFDKLPSVLKRSVTFDNGRENYQHEKLTKQNGVKTYFCNAYHAWEKGTVENQISLIRQYVPKKTDLSQINQADLNAIALELNNRPRKLLGFYTPEEIMLKEVGWGNSY